LDNLFKINLGSFSLTKSKPQNACGSLQPRRKVQQKA
jgi:hypothetical protein